MTQQFRQRGIFIHNTQAIPVPPMEPKTPTMLEEILQLLWCAKPFFTFLFFSGPFKDIQNFLIRRPFEHLNHWLINPLTALCLSLGQTEALFS